MSLTATDARKATEKHLATVVIKPVIESIDTAILRHAEQGKSELINPLNAALDLTASNRRAIELEVRKHYERCGFKWVDHPDPDPGHPASAPYTSLSW